MPWFAQFVFALLLLALSLPASRDLALHQKFDRPRDRYGVRDVLAALAALNKEVVGKRLHLYQRPLVPPAK